MASDFEYERIENNKHIFKELSTGMTYSILAGSNDETVTLLDGDEVEISSSRHETMRYSIRQDRRLS